jgi:hypothetical protein
MEQRAATSWAPEPTKQASDLSSVTLQKTPWWTAPGHVICVVFTRGDIAKPETTTVQALHLFDKHPDLLKPVIKKICYCSSLLKQR